MSVSKFPLLGSVRCNLLMLHWKQVLLHHGQFSRQLPKESCILTITDKDVNLKASYNDINPHVQQ